MDLADHLLVHQWRLPRHALRQEVHLAPPLQVGELRDPRECRLPLRKDSVRSAGNFDADPNHSQNEPNLEKYMGATPGVPAYEYYTKIYDGIVSVLTKDHPQIAITALCLAQGGDKTAAGANIFADDWFEFFFKFGSLGQSSRE